MVIKRNTVYAKIMLHAHPHAPRGKTSPLNMDEIKSMLASGAYEIVENNLSSAMQEFDLVHDEENNVVMLVNLSD